MDSTNLQLPADSIPQFTGQPHEIWIVMYLVLGLILMFIFALIGYLRWRFKKNKTPGVNLDPVATEGYGYCLLSIAIVTPVMLGYFLLFHLPLQAQNLIFWVVLILFGGFFWGITIWTISFNITLSRNVKKARKAPKEKEYHTPLILRIGFPYAWWVTGLVILIPTIVHTALLFISGAGGLFLINAPILIIIDALLLLLATWAVRATFNGFDELFDILGVKPKYYFGFKRPPESTPKVQPDSPNKTKPTDSQQAIRDLFISDTEYDTFRKKVLRTIYTKREFRWMVAVLPLFFIHLYYWLGDPFYWTYHGYVGAPYVQWSLLFAVFVALFLYMVGITAIRQIFAYFWVIRDLRREKEHLRIWKYAKEPFKEKDDAEKAGYHPFYLNTAPIGRKVYQSSLAIIIIAGILIVRNAFYIEWVNRQIVTPGQWIIALVTIPAAFVLFLLPQLEIHQLLNEAKQAILKVWYEEFCQLSREFITTLHKIRKGEYEKKLNRELKKAEKKKLEEKKKLSKDEKQEIIEKHEHDIKENLESKRLNLEALRILIEDTSMESTWSFDTQMVLNISGASAIPTVTAIIQTLMMPLF